MNFEEALRAEIGAIEGLSNKVFPLNATEGTQAPFIIYVAPEGIPFKTLQGYLSCKEVVCEIHILHNSYSGMKTLSKQVLEKIQSFQGRELGSGGPFIQNATYEQPTEVYEKEVSLYRSSFDLNVKF